MLHWYEAQPWLFWSIGGYAAVYGVLIVVVLRNARTGAARTDSPVMPVLAFGLLVTVLLNLYGAPTLREGSLGLLLQTAFLAAPAALYVAFHVLCVWLPNKLRAAGAPLA